MDVLNSLLSFILIISFVSGLQDNVTKGCVDHYSDTDGKTMTKSEIDNKCQGRHCIAKCCPQKDTFFFVNQRDNSPTTCINESTLLSEFNETVKFDESLKVFEGSSEADANLVTRNLSYYYVVHNSKINKGCASGIEMEPQDLYLFNVSISTQPEFHVYIRHFALYIVRHWSS